MTENAGFSPFLILCARTSVDPSALFLLSTGSVVGGDGMVSWVSFADWSLSVGCSLESSVFLDSAVSAFGENKPLKPSIV